MGADLKKVMLDPGHGGRDPGASFRGLLEKHISLAVCRKIQDLLQYKYWVAMTRNEDVFISLIHRADLANLWGADIFVSVHCNADPDEDAPGMTEARGEEIWIYRNSFKGKRLAQSLKLVVDECFPENPFRGIKATTHLSVLRRTRMPAALVELGFIDNRATNTMLVDPDTISRIGQLLVAGIMRYLSKG